MAAWRFLVALDREVASPPVRVTSESLDEWLKNQGPSVSLPGGKERLIIDGAESFAPSNFARRFDLQGPALDDVLHAPAIQRVESAWRGLRMLLENAGKDVEVDVLSAPRREIPARVREAGIAAEERGDAYSLVLVDADYDHQPSTLASLSELARAAEEIQAPVVAHASSGFFDLRYFVQAVRLSDLVTRLSDNAHAGFRSFQETDGARWTVLTLGRWLQRAPYTAADGHPEKTSESEPETFLWGRGPWLVGAAVARSVRTHGHALDLGGPAGTISGLATRPFSGFGTTSALAAEAPLPEQAAMELIHAAFTPILGILDRDAVTMLRVVTVHRLKPGRLTVEGTLAYQITASRLARACNHARLAVPSGASTGLADDFQRSLSAEVLPLAGESGKVEDVLMIETRPGDSGPPVTRVSVRPRATIEGKPLEFVFDLRG